MKIALIATVLNEKHTVGHLMTSIWDQTMLPDEIIIVDGGSTDGTFEELQRLAEENKTGVKTIILQKEGNRSVGRNEAIRHAKGDTIVCTDAGSFPEKYWIERIIKPFSYPNIEVVAGYYEAKTETIFQECLVPFVFVMPDKVRYSTFMPASRSMAFTKHIWEQAGGFPEQFSHNEDYVFAHTLRKIDAKIWFVKDAIVYWIPRKTFAEAYQMFYRFALGDAEAKILRPKVSFIFLRYIIGFLILGFAIYTESLWAFGLSLIFVTAYVFWSIVKNYRYVDDPHALYLLPSLQITSDLAVMLGSIRGWLPHKWDTKKTS